MYITLLKKILKNNLKLKTNRIINVINTNKALITYYTYHLSFIIYHQQLLTTLSTRTSRPILRIIFLSFFS